MDKIEVTEATHVDKADAWDAVTKARSEGFTAGHKAGMIAAAGIANGFGVNRDWVPKSLYETLRREVAAAILAAAEEK